MAHKHFCLKCNAAVAEGDFDCGRDADHDFEVCAKCRSREKASADWIKLNARTPSHRFRSDEAEQ
jgi:hypothetical protein